MVQPAMFVTWGVMASFALAQAQDFQYVHPDQEVLSLHQAGEHARDFDLTDSNQDEELRAELMKIVESRRKIANKESIVGLALVDITNPHQLRWAGINDESVYEAGSSVKTAILLGNIYNYLKGNSVPERQNALYAYEPELVEMIQYSRNFSAGRMYAVASFPSILSALKMHGLYDAQKGGMWVGTTYIPPAIGLWAASPELSWVDLSLHDDPISGLSRAGSARQFARLLLQMEQGKIMNQPWASRVMKAFMRNTCISYFAPRLGARCRPREKSDRGIFADDRDVVFWGKNGSFSPWDSEMITVYGKNYKYIFALIISHPEDFVMEYFGKSVNRLIRMSH